MVRTYWWIPTISPDDLQELVTNPWRRNFLLLESLDRRFLNKNFRCRPHRCCLKFHNFAILILGAQTPFKHQYLSLKSTYRPQQPVQNDRNGRVMSSGACFRSSKVFTFRDICKKLIANRMRIVRFSRASKFGGFCPIKWSYGHSRISRPPLKCS